MLPALRSKRGGLPLFIPFLVVGLLAACGVEEEVETEDPQTGVVTRSVGAKTVLIAPDLKVTSHIRSFSTDAYMNELDANPAISHNFFRRLAMRLALDQIRNSANPEPIDAFTPASWSAFQASKEYRGYAHLSQLAITCVDGQVTEHTSPVSEASPGYTPEGSSFTIGSEYLPSSMFVPGLYTRTSSLNRCVTMIDQRASRMSDSLRSAQRLAFGYDAPFIWTRVRDELCCDGTNHLSVESSAFPTHRVYVADKQVKVIEQRGWAAFVVSGGTTAHATGKGNLAPEGETFSR